MNKFFFAIGTDGDLVSSNFWIDLVRRGHRAIWSVPSGHLLRISPTRCELRLDKLAVLPFDDGEDETGLDHVIRIREALQRTFQRLATAIIGRPLFITLSGGLDSTAIAVLARRYLGAFTAVTFSIDDGCGELRPTEDLRYARRVADDLGVPLRVVQASADELLGLLDVALCYGQDWRDFNVHCALVNAAIGHAIGASDHASRPVLLTGDTMNELMADYTPVTYRDREYYPLPRIPAGRLRRFLVRGLDAGDREIGVFAHYGLDAVQPYALCAEAFTSLPGGCLDRPGAKQRVVREVMGAAIPSYIYDRPKVRAQAGGADEVRGTLAALVDREVDSARLKRRFCELFDVDPAELHRFIRDGFYRFTTSYPDLLGASSQG